MDKQLEQATTIEYKVNYRDIRHPRLEFKTGTLHLILPRNYKKEKQLLQKHQKWINTKQQAIQTALKQTKTKQLNQARTTKQLKTLVSNLTLQYQNELCTRTNKTFYRRMKTKWASYSENRNLTVNTFLQYLPENLIKYIIYHELTHAHERRHNKKFWNLINQKFKDYPTKERDLLIYWFLVQRKLSSSSNTIMQPSSP